MATCRPPVPTDAERARGIAVRGGEAALVGTGTAPVRPLVHHVWADGSATVLLADDDPLVARVGDGGLAAMLEVADQAPVDLREPVRGLLWITGLLTRPADARRLAAVVAEVRPDAALLDLGHGASLMRLDPGSVVVSDGDGTAALRPAALAAARPDPFARWESRWLAHLEESHPSVLRALGRLLPPPVGDGRVRPLGVDRCGIRLRVETAERDHDVRLAWSHPVGTPAELRVQLDALVGSCPSGPHRRVPHRQMESG